MLGNLFRRSTGFSELNNPNTPLYQAIAGLEMGGYGPATSGASVTTTTAMRVSAVYRCVTLIAQTIASLPLGVYRYERDRRVELTNPAERYLWGKPNEEMSRAQMWAATIGSAVLTGDAYIYKVRNGLGNVAEIWPLNPRMVSPVRLSSGEKKFRVAGDGDLVGKETILHVPGYSADGFKGLNPIAQMREALGLAMSAEEFGGRFFGQGSTMSGILTTDGKLDDDTAVKLEKRWNSARAGTRNAFKTAILEGGLKWQQVGVNPEDGQFLETRRFQVEEIARMFGVPPHLLGAVDKTTSWGSGIEEQNIAFVTYTLRWWMTLFEQAITDDLLLPENRYAKWEVNGLLRGNTAQRYASYQIGRNAGFLSPNDIRKLEDLPPIDGGDDYTQPLNSAGGKDAAPADTAPPKQGATGDE